MYYLATTHRNGSSHDGWAYGEAGSVVGISLDVTDMLV